ncbi:peptidoglycan D,D-transpeptidase FtsI family protein [Campylobacter mucosalis]|uniref:peptidoglycan D,D-transpeptidase FtsI family protein n=1 Tax=Campylobacter mucosalis TaxID=202 RepID=UPI00146FDF3C|nr:penicillin-binding protein 2 [Campylobacter mucosalis]
MIQTNPKKSKITFIFLFITFGVIIFIAVVFYRASIERKLPRLQTSEINTALRGSIITKDGFSVAHSQKLYKVMLDTRNIDPNKKDLFIKLYSLYTNDDPKKIESIINSTKGLVTLSYTVEAKDAAYLRELARRLYKKSIFISYRDPKTGLARLSGIDVVESGQNRTFMAKDALTPIIGYTRKKEDNKITKVSGTKGIERSYERYLAPAQDAKLIGPRDVGNNIVFTSDSNIANRVDGYNVVLSVSLKFQTMLEKILDERREFLDAQEIIVCVMHSNTGKILALASSSRYDPSNIKKQDYRALNSTATEYAYEVGSVFKPFIFSILLSEKKVTTTERIKTYNGEYKLGKRTIRDTHPADYMPAADIIKESSNIGMVVLSSRLSGVQIYDGLMKFGFSQKTDIDMPYEQVGIIPPINKLNSETYKGTVSYGYGLTATFMQLMKAYNAFNNKGVMLTPMLADHLERNGVIFDIPDVTPPKQAISQEVAKQMKWVLIKVVEDGTGKKARTPGIEVGGKTGTAHIASRSGGYANLYNGSFFGFANDKKGNSYTIGVLAREPKKKYYYFGAQSALPVFKKTVDLLVSEGYLVPSAEDIQADLAKIKSQTGKDKEAKD